MPIFHFPFNPCDYKRESMRIVKSQYLETDVMPRSFKSVIIILFYSLHSPSLGSFLASVSAANIKIE